MKRLLFTASIICLILSSCSKDRLRANGDITTETRSPGAFSGVETSGSKHIHISYGQEYKAELRGSSNLIPAYRTKVVNGMLTLYYERVNVLDDDLEVYITMPEIDRIHLSGSGKITARGNFRPTSSFTARISGSGDVEVRDQFVAESIYVSLSGSGSAELLQIDSKHSDISISGSGNVRTSASESLRAKISGSGVVMYKGNASVSSDISGSGKIQQLK